MSVMSLARPPRLRAKDVGSWHLAAKLFRWASGGGAIIAREFHVRRDMRRLAGYDDYMLRDIGITRMDIDRIVRDGRDR
jgi:hypothetical protein